MAILKPISEWFFLCDLKKFPGTWFMDILSLKFTTFENHGNTIENENSSSKDLQVQGELLPIFY